MKNCDYCKGTGLDPNSYDEHIQSNGFWFARPCKYCEGTGRMNYVDNKRNLSFLIFYALHNFKLSRGDCEHLFYE